MISLFIEYVERHKSKCLSFMYEISEFSSEIIDLWPKAILNIFFLLSKDLEMRLCLRACTRTSDHPSVYFHKYILNQ